MVNPLRRPVRIDDWAAIHDVANEALPNAPDGNAGWLDSRRAFDETQHRRRHYVVELDGQVVAYGGIEETGDGRWRLFNVMRADKLEAGLGDEMFERLLSDVREFGGSVAWMREQADDRLLPFVGARGFVETRRFVVRDGSSYDGVEVVELERAMHADAG